MNPRPANQPHNDEANRVEEIRLIADLRIMHAKVDELHHIVANLKRRHADEAIHKYADRKVLSENVGKVDEIYLWFLSLKESSPSSRLRA
jgi:hypothetical protein